jgi:folate-binding protein YgfZ
MPNAHPPVSGTSRPDAALVAARDSAVFCDLAPVAMLAIGGADATAFLHGQLSIDVGHLSSGACRYATYNSPKGRMLANVVLWRAKAGADDYRALVPGDIAESVRKRLAMFVLRSKVTLSDVTAAHLRLGVGGPRATEALRTSLGVVPAPHEIAQVDEVTVLGLVGSRFALVTPVEQGSALRTVLAECMTEGDFAVWQWLAIRAGVPVVTAATQDAFVAQTANMDILGGIDFNKGCYTGQEVIARMQYLGRLKERAFLFHADGTGAAAGTRLFNAVFGEQACGTVVNAAPAPGGGSDLLAVIQLAAVERGDTRLGDPAGPPLVQLPLPYEMPAPVAPRGRIA